MKKSLFISIVIVIFSAIFFCLSGYSDAVTSPTATPLGYNTLSGSVPARIATNNEGGYYFTDTPNNKVYAFSNNGVLLLSFDVGKPLGIAVDQSGNIFVGSLSDGSVSVYDSQGSFLYSLGSGIKEFGLPSDIAVSSSGVVYVTDSERNVVKAYSLSGSPLFSFGSDYLRFPTGIAIDEAAGQIYVSSNIDYCIRIYDFNGTYKTYRGRCDPTSYRNSFLVPQGLALDSTRLYIVDPLNSTVVVYDKSSDTFLKYMGNYGTNAGEYITPLDIAFDKDNKIFVTNSNNSRVEIVGIDSFTQLNVNPAVINFSVYKNGSPVSQTVNIASVGNTTTSWTASPSGSWVSISSSSGTTPSDVNVTVDPTGFSAGNYTARVNFTTPAGTVTVLQINLEVKPNSLSVAPTNLSFKYQQESPGRPSGDIVITASGGTILWTAASSASWIGLGSTSGSTPSTVKLNITDAVKGLSAGLYNGSIVIDGGIGTQGSPATIGVTLNVIYAGTIKVTTNLDEAGFDISGPTTYSGAGKNWSNDEVSPGDYTITFKHVSGYLRPAARTFTVKTGNEVDIDVQYRAKPVATHIVAGSGSTKGKKVVVMNLDGTTVSSFEPFRSPESVRVAAGDMDGSGIDKIAVTDKKRTIKVYTYEGTKLDELTMPEGYKKAVITTGDIDGDGKAEIIIGAEVEGQGRTIKRFGYANGKIEEKDVLYSESKYEEFTVTLGDTDGDGTLELVTADKDSVKAFKIDLSASDGNKLTEIWTTDAVSDSVPEVAAGDINDDGTSEIALSISTNTVTDKNKKETGVIKILKGTGEDYGLSIDAYGDLGYKKPSTVALGDMDGDGVDEIAAGAGRDEHNDELIRTFESDGTFTGLTITAMDSKFGVNVTLGRFE